MGRNGYVVTRPTEYGHGIKDDAQTSLYRYLSANGVLVLSPSYACNVEDADSWEIPLDRKTTAKLRKLVDRMRENPGMVAGYFGDGYGIEAAAMLEDGLECAKRHRTGFITIDWF